MPYQESLINSSPAFFGKKKYTVSEHSLQLWVKLCSLFVPDEFRQAIAKGDYIDPRVRLAFRADTRKPEIIFSEGFSAYAFCRFIPETRLRCHDLYAGIASHNFDEGFAFYLKYCLALPLVLIILAIQCVFEILINLFSS